MFDKVLNTSLYLAPNSERNLEKTAKVTLQSSFMGKKHCKAVTFSNNFLINFFLMLPFVLSLKELLIFGCSQGDQKMSKQIFSRKFLLGFLSFV